jgi:hypothetical protein
MSRFLCGQGSNGASRRARVLAAPEPMKMEPGSGVHDWSNRAYGGYEELKGEAVRSPCRASLDAEMRKMVGAADDVKSNK